MGISNNVLSAGIIISNVQLLKSGSGDLRDRERKRGRERVEFIYNIVIHPVNMNGTACIKITYKTAFLIQD